METLADQTSNVSQSDLEEIFKSKCQRDNIYYDLLQDDQDKFFNETMDKVDNKLEDAKQDVKLYVNEQTSLGRVTKFLEGLNQTIETQREVDNRMDKIELDQENIRERLGKNHMKESEVKRLVNTTEQNLKEDIEDVETSTSNRATGNSILERTTTQFWGLLLIGAFTIGGVGYISKIDTPWDPYVDQLVQPEDAHEIPEDKESALADYETGDMEENTAEIYELDGEDYTEDGLKRLGEELKSQGATLSSEQEEKLEEIQKIVDLED